MAKDSFNIEVSLPRIKVVINGRYFDPREAELTPEQKEKMVRALDLFASECLKERRRAITDGVYLRRSCGEGSSESD
jgi:hypothetical protein